MNRFMRRFPSPPLVVSITALVISLGGAGYSATGGNFILGQANNASTQTRLVTPLNGAAFRIDNISIAANATGMTIVTNAARPPLAVTSSVKVARLNADKLDGLDSTQFPNKLVVPFDLAPGAITAQIDLPANQPVFVMGVIATGDYSVGQVTLLRTPASGIGAFLTWVGLESPSPSVITSGFSAAAGTHIVFIDTQHMIDIEVNGPNTIRVHNGSGGQQAGVVTLIW